jgi:hypothetical protein
MERIQNQALCRGIQVPRVYFTLPHIVHLDSITPSRLHMELWSPYGVHMEYIKLHFSLIESWTPCGVQLDPTWTPPGVHMEST